MTRLYIAVIDDERDLVQLFVDAIEANHYHVRGFDDPIEATISEPMSP